jgi:type III secretory pathway component EscU
MTALIIGKVILWIICIVVFYIGMCLLDYWLGKIFNKRS